MHSDPPKYDKQDESIIKRKENDTYMRVVAYMDIGINFLILSSLKKKFREKNTERSEQRDVIKNRAETRATSYGNSC